MTRTLVLGHLLEKWTPERNSPLKAWYAIAAKAYWSSPTGRLKIGLRTSLRAIVVATTGLYLNIGGNRYRLIVRFDYAHRIGFVRFVGTHAEYDAVDASRV